MNPLYFGPSDRHLFGAFSQSRSRGRLGAVLLCYPILGEYLRAHRAFRQLTTLLGRAGLSVLRFDYACTGDSAGPGEDARLAEWLEDVDWAVDELKAMVGVEQVSIAGLRFGATIAALACTRRTDVEKLVLWDPIVSGRAYVEAMLGAEPPESTEGVEGVPMAPELRRELEGVDLTGLGELSVASASILVAEDDRASRSLHRHLEALGVKTDFEVVPSSGSWTEADPLGAAYIPERIIRSVVDRLGSPTGVTS
ncbi:MAG: hypothetical protein RQ745_11980 [Longimicrobiales bacterium]|nr:hypothetical protein [Longimicrobiales bacterium]